MKKISGYIRAIFSRFGIHLVKNKSGNDASNYTGVADRPLMPRFVNLGAGAFFHPFWHNVDMPNPFYSRFQNNLHIKHDFNSEKKLNIKDKSVEIFYTSHVIEHLSNEIVQNLFEDVYRCLDDQGIFRISCPDMELQYFAYKNKDNQFWMQPSPWGTYSDDIEIRYLEHFATILTFGDVTALKNNMKKYAVNTSSAEEFYKIFEKYVPSDSNSKLPEGHCNWFTKKKLIKMLSDAGFKKIYESAYLQSASSKMRNPCLFDGTSPELSLYIECQK